MSEKLRIIVADDEPILVRQLKMILEDAGHDVLAAVDNGRELVDKCLELSPDLVITDIKMPGMDGLEAAKEISDKQPTPIIVVSGYHDEDHIERATDRCVMSYLVKPVDEVSLRATIPLVMRQFREFQQLYSENAGLKQLLEDRKVIERAKGILMKRTGLDEEVAFLRLQKLAREKSTRLADIARSVVTADQVFDD